MEDENKAKPDKEEEDDLIEALKAAKEKKVRNSPDIKTSGLITDSASTASECIKLFEMGCFQSDTDDDNDDMEDDKKATPEEEEEDDLIKALKAAREKKVRKSPPDIKSSGLSTDLSFHPEADIIIAIGNICGELSVWNYSIEENKIEKKLKLSKKTLERVGI